MLPTPSLSVSPHDTTYCSKDSIRLTATGVGSFSWQPSTNLIGGNTATPLAFPSTLTTYFATINVNGCTRRDSIRLNPLNDLANHITATPDTICQKDTLILVGTANHSAITWQWSPLSLVGNPTGQSTTAFPVTSTIFTLTSHWGRCITSTTKNIVVRPLAVAVAGNDALYCIGQQAVQLHASGGINYSWSPAAGLSDPNIADPFASPVFTTQYIVGMNTNECSRKTYDTVLVIARPKPLLTLTNDTLICIIDTLRLNTIASTNPNTFLWTPDYMISSLGVPDPLVSPDIPTLYHVLVTDSAGCFKSDSVYVDVKAEVTVDAGNDTSICRADHFIIGATGDAVTYSWSPAEGLNNVNIRNPIASPDSTTLYTVTANIGKCEKQSQVKIVVALVPLARASGDTTVCLGQSTRLFATGGSKYEWIPGAFLSDKFIANPFVNQPTSTIKYIVTVSDTLGCPRKTKDSIIVRVIPYLQVDAGPPDTAIVSGQMLLLHGTGAINYLWTPDIWINDHITANPVVNPPQTTVYHVLGTDQYGCVGSDSITVFVYDLIPGMYVPTAFTPNGDGYNDDIKPLMIGMRSLNYFRVYNRFGEMVFSTTQQGKGWDGIYKGSPQSIATFVWTASGTTFKGDVITKKGFVVLIR